MADGEPVKLAGAARFDLSADDQVGKIENGRVIEGNGSIERQELGRRIRAAAGLHGEFPGHPSGLASLTVRFTPATSGTVTLTLMGPFEEASKGVVYRQEVLWDDVRVEGASSGRRRL